VSDDPKPDKKPEQPAPPKPPSVTMPATIQVAAGRLARLQIAYDGDDFQYSAPAALDVFREYDPSSQAVTLRLIGYEAGTYDVVAVTCKGGKLSAFGRCAITVGTPVPPGPGPGPGPQPPGPAPIPASGLRVLMIYDQKHLTDLPAGQQSILRGADMRTYLNAKAAPGTDGKTKEWRMWPADADPGTDAGEKLFGDAMKRERKSLPWIVISNGKAGFEGPLPASVDATKQLIDKYAGN
jgi:hypothetical protein